jgi:membrane fusion protein (multidrug efflux system)
MRRWLALLALASSACHGGGDAAEEATPLVRVTTATVECATLPEQASLVGRLSPRPGSVAVLSAPADAVVRSLTVQVGSPVRAGQLLVDLDAPELEANAVALRATADAAERDATRQAELLQQGIASRRSVEEQQAAATSARAAADAARRVLERTRVTSPLDGRVQRVLVNPGERVSSGASLVEVIRPGLVDFVAQAPAPVLARLRPGQPATVSVPGAGRPASARVHAVAPAVDSSTNSGTAILRLAPDPAMLPGAGATATVTLGRLDSVLVVPDSALVLVGDSLSVFAVQADSTVRRVAVRVLARSGGRAAVAGPLAPGARVVSTGAYGLAQGMKVEPAP